MQRLRGDVSAVRPGDRSSFEKEPLEIPYVLERLKDRPLQPRRKINRAFHSVIEDETNFELGAVFSLGNGRQCMHWFSSVERGDPIECLTRRDATPVRLKLLSVRHGPFLNEADGRPGANASCEQAPV